MHSHTLIHSYTHIFIYSRRDCTLILIHFTLIDSCNSTLIYSIHSIHSYTDHTLISHTQLFVCYTQ